MDRDNDVRTASSTQTLAGQALQRRFSRRALLKTAGQMSAGAIAFGIIGDTVSAKTPSRIPTRPVASYDSEVATEWIRLSLQLVQETPGFSPPVAARALGYLGVTLYESLVPGMPGYQSLAGQLNELASLQLSHDHAYHWPLVANSALAAMARHLFPTATPANLAAVDALESAYTHEHSIVQRGVVHRSIERGQAVAAHIAAWAMTDGGHAGYLTNFPADYTPPAGPGLWEPTPPNFQRALQPYWGNNRPFVLSSGAQVDLGPPPPFSTDPGSALYAEAYEVYASVNQLTDEQRAIALFWADNAGQTSTPPGHVISILTQVIEERGASLAVAAEAYAKAGIAVSDALISCWHSKFAYNLLRPISYIQQHIDPAWGSQMPLTTPPFPEYPSGHSVQTAAFARVLLDMFGDFPFTDHTHDARGLAPRTFPSCLAMAEEAAISRLYGGIHFRSAIENGIEQGTEVGRLVNRLAFLA